MRHASFLLLLSLTTSLLATSGCVTVGERTLIAAADVLNRNAGLTEKRVQVAGHNVVYLEGGQGTPLLVLHGFSAKKEHFSLMATALVPHHRVFIPDVPGFGESSYDPAKVYSPAEQATRLLAFADAIGLERFAIAGNSMGGHLATLIAAKVPDRISHIVLLSPAGILAPEKSDFVKLLDGGVNPFALKTDADAARLLDLQFHEAPDAIGFVKPALFAQMRRRGARNASLFRDYAGDRQFDASAQLATVVAPTLILWGEHDQMLDKSAGPMFVAAMPRATLISLENCGHLPQLERPTETAAHILRFLAVASAPVTSSTSGSNVSDDGRRLSVAQVIDAPNGAQVIDAPTGAQVIDAPNGAQVIDAPNGVQVIDAPNGAQVIDAPTGAQVIDAPTGAQVIDAPTGAQVIDAQTGAQVIDAQTGAQR